VAIVVGLSMAVLLGFAGLALDLARLYVNKSELQSAADACALAAATELTCAAGTTSCLLNGTAAGQLVASKSRSDFQGGAVAIAANDIRFNTAYVPNANYLDAASGAPGNSRYAMCTARSAGITPWLMGMVGVQGNTLITATAVASLLPAGGGGSCPSAPIGVCPPNAGGNYAPGDWVAADATDSKSGTGLGDPTTTGVQGTFRWVDWDYSAGGSNEVRDRLASGGETCGITGTSSNIAEEGVKQGVKDAWNSRFGVYANGANAYSVLSAPPDRTGYAYPTKAPGSPVISVGTSAFADYRAKQSTATPFQGKSGGYDAQGKGNPQVNGNSTSSADHQTYGADRRLVTVPIINGCTKGSAPTSAHLVTVQSMACFLMLSPMANGANGDVFMEYIGPADAPNSPCINAGSPGGPGGAGGALVPTLVQ